MAEALSEVIGPAVQAVFQDGEVSVTTVRFEPELEEGSITHVADVRG